MDNWAITKFEGKNKFLSNSFEYPMQIGELALPTLEHAYCAALVSSPEDRERIANTKTVEEVREYRESLETRSMRRAQRVLIMQKLIEMKFKHPVLQELLLNTTGSKLVYGNERHDMFWGMCMCPKHMYSGRDALGVILTDRRNKLAKS